MKTKFIKNANLELLELIKLRSYEKVKLLSKAFFNYELIFLQISKLISNTFEISPRKEGQSVSQRQCFKSGPML
jgi:hypothetical protein